MEHGVQTTRPTRRAKQWRAHHLPDDGMYAPRVQEQYHGHKPMASGGVTCAVARTTLMGAVGACAAQLHPSPVTVMQPFRKHISAYPQLELV